METRKKLPPPPPQVNDTTNGADAGDDKKQNKVESPEDSQPLFEIEVNYLTLKNEFLLDIPEEGTGYVVLRNETIVEEPEPPI